MKDKLDLVTYRVYNIITLLILIISKNNFISVKYQCTLSIQIPKHIYSKKKKVCSEIIGVDVFIVCVQKKKKKLIKPNQSFHYQCQQSSAI